MNKKRFTLLVAALMLMISVFSVNAANPPVYGDFVKNLPSGLGKGAYHLQLTHVGDTALVNEHVLALDDHGYVVLRDADYVKTAADDSSYYRLRTSLWCVDVKAAEVAGKVPTYKFINKEYNADLSVWNESVWYKKRFQWPSVASAHIGDSITYFSIGANEKALLGGALNGWRFSRTYDDADLEQSCALAIEIEPDYFVTFAKRDTALSTVLSLVRVHANDLEPSSDFYKKHLARFSLRQAGPRVLRAVDFNTKLRELAAEEFITLAFTPDVSEGQKNLFTSSLKAEQASAANYLNLKGKDSGKYISILDGANLDNYYNVAGIKYPKYGWVDKVADNGQADFRFVYYPSEDSVIANVRHINHIEYGVAFDDGDDTHKVHGHNLYDWTIWNRLIVRMQDLTTDDGSRVITAYNKPGNTRIHFGIKGCEVIETDRTTVETDLYTIKDSKGRFLVVPLFAGDFTPQWVKLDENEQELKTPSYQWIVTKINEDYKYSKIRLTNREFDWMHIDFVQVYESLRPFHGFTHVYSESGSTVDQFTPIEGALISKESFIRVEQPYRNDSYLGYKYINKDTLNYWSYSFNYLHKYGDDYYFGFDDKKDDASGEKLLYVTQERTYFGLALPDTLLHYSTEKYGAGYKNSGYVGYGEYTHPRLKDVAPLERYYYYFHVNDYYKFNRQDDYVTLGSNLRYKTEAEKDANASEKQKAKFYLRFTYEVGGEDYYALVDRIEKSNFNFVHNELGLGLMKIIKAHDDSHGNFTNKSFGVLCANVTDNDLTVRAQPKTTGTRRVSTFKLGTNHEPLYRRFNTTLEAETPDDTPKVLKIVRYNNTDEYVYEDSHTAFSGTLQPVQAEYYSKIRFMGVQNAHEDKALIAKDPKLYPHNFNIYIDTAYVNRGTGWIKPQYLLVLDPKRGEGGRGCNLCGDSFDIYPYVWGRYLRNMTDSARYDTVNVLPNSKVQHEEYIWNGSWERLAFVDAIHSEDYLYILNGHTPEIDITTDNKKYINFKKLAAVPGVKAIFLGNNLHKDVVFSMRFVERQNNPSASKHFLIESETTKRNSATGRMIAPTSGGWVKLQNNVPVISRGAYNDAINQAEMWDVIKGDGDPVANEAIATDEVTVVAGVDQVLITNASGKRVTISNVLGQVISTTIVQGNSATITAPKGVVVVAVEGEKAVKALVK